VPGLTLDLALTIITAAFASAREAGSKPLCVVVLDAGGHVLAVHRQETASLFRPAIATAKATGALGMGMGSRAISDRAQQSPAFFASLSAVTNGGMAIAPGGVLIRDGSGAILGAVGVSGDTSDIDELCAVAGIQAAGFHADTGVKREDPG
jgi:uncharacterized protein GlcG (DUF336 family)